MLSSYYFIDNLFFEVSISYTIKDKFCRPPPPIATPLVSEHLYRIFDISIKAFFKERSITRRNLSCEILEMV